MVELTWMFSLATPLIFFEDGAYLKENIKNPTIIHTQHTNGVNETTPTTNFVPNVVQFFVIRPESAVRQPGHLTKLLNSEGHLERASSTNEMHPSDTALTECQQGMLTNVCALSKWEGKMETKNKGKERRKEEGYEEAKDGWNTVFRGETGGKRGNKIKGKQETWKDIEKKRPKKNWRSI